MSIPPDEIKTIIDKTAKFVAKLGADFQQRIYDNERNNPKFSFLETADPFHPFYQSRVEYFRQELASSGTLVATQAASSWSGAEPPAAPPPSPPREGAGGETVAASEPPKHGQNSLAWKVFQMEKKMKGMTIEPPAPFHFIGEIPEDITPLDLDIMKLTAQFVARNGHQFQTGLMNREHKNPQFEFLKPNSEQNPYFQQLVESYSKCIVASKDTVNKMKIEYNRQLLLDKLILRYQYNRDQEKLQREKEKLEKEETMSANIDWHDFVIVETIDFRDEDQLGNIGNGVGSNSATGANVSMPMPSNIISDEMETEMEVEMEVEQPSMDITMSKPPSEMRIRRDYVKPTSRVVDSSKKTTKCPKCGMDIPVDEIEEHMRIELLDPRYAQQRQIQLERSRATTSATDTDIAKNLGAFAKRRTDIFEDDLDYAPAAPSVNAIPSKSIQDQIQAIHERKGLVPPPPSQGGSKPPPPPGINPPPLPPAKKLKTGEEDNLIPEKEFLEKHKNSPQITLTVQCPAEEKSEWNLKGQSIQITLNLTDNVTTLKDKIKDAIGMPPNKMKLKGGELHLKDDSMAYYNFTTGSVIQLSKRERGGKR